MSSGLYKSDVLFLPHSIGRSNEKSSHIENDSTSIYSQVRRKGRVAPDVVSKGEVFMNGDEGFSVYSELTGR